MTRRERLDGLFDLIEKLPNDAVERIREAAITEAGTTILQVNEAIDTLEHAMAYDTTGREQWP